MFAWSLLLIVGILVASCFGKEFYCSNNYNYGLIDLHGNGLRVDSKTSITFQTKGRNDAHILLQKSRSDENNNVVEIVLGGWGNSQSVIRNRKQGSALSTYRGSVLNSGSYYWFWISWSGGCVQVGKGSSVGSSRIMNWCGLSHSIAGMRISYGFGSDGYFNFVTDCSTPGTISYGSRSFTGVSDGSRVTYTCNAGYTITSGSSTRTCSSGSWSGSQPTCGDVNECSSNPCRNGATCNNLSNRYTCTCSGGWTGTNCDQDINECSSNPCKNGGACTNGQNRFTCACASGWTGSTCSTDVNECASNPCKNGATCTNGQNSYTCTCAGGYTGTNCDQDINECSSNPCTNGATCNNLVNRYTCTCTGGWQGTNCDQDVNECASNPCKNGATCTNGRNEYTCTCAAGWTGTNCDIDIDECASNPCQNGATCNNLLDLYTCDCAGGWQGYDCDQDIDECLSSPCVNGTCTNLQNAYSCTCFPDYTAKNCDYLIGSPMDGQWGQWEAWQGCSVTCGTGRQRRYRACDNPPPDYGGQPCVGDSFEENVCTGLGTCPVAVDGNWGAWSALTTCSATCGTGHSTKVRACDNPAPSNGGQVCTGDAMVVTQCSVTACNMSGSANGTSYGAAYTNVCPGGYFTCNSGTITCIMEAFRCDCLPDCGDSSDENQVWAGCDILCSTASGLTKSWKAICGILILLQAVYKMTA